MVDEKTGQLSKVPPQQSKERVDIRERLLTRIREMQDSRNMIFPIIRNRTLTDYWDDSMKRFIQFKERPAYKEKWQANIASSTPGDKLVSILSRLAGQSMEIQIMANDDTSIISRLKERVLGACIKSAGKKNDDDRQLIFEEMAAMSKGTVIGFEGWKHGKMKVRDIVDQDPETGEVKIKERTIKKWNDVYSELVPIEDFYPGSVYVRPGVIQDMADCAMRKVFKKDTFDFEYGKYIDVDKVQTRQDIRMNQYDELFYKLTPDIKDDEVEVWYYFNQYTDEFVILANGIWINPMGSSGVMPLLWNHKKLPFWANVFEPLSDDFFYGRSLPDKLISMSDMSDATFDRILDQLALAAYKPILTRDKVVASSLTRGFMSPGNVIKVKGTGDIRGDVTTLDVQEPSPVYIKMLEVIENRLDKTSFSSDLNTNAPKTATQVLKEAEVAIEFASLFLKFMEFGMRDKNRLRLANIIQFYTLPIHKEDEDAKWRKIVLRDEKLANGKIGTRKVEFTDEDMTLAQFNAEEEAGSSYDEIEVLKVSPSFIRNFDGDVQIVPATSVKRTETVRQSMELTFQQVMNQLYPDKMNRDAGFEDLLRVFNKDQRRMKAQTPAEEMDMLDTKQGSTSVPQVETGIGQGLGGSLRKMAQV